MARQLVGDAVLAAAPAAAARIGLSSGAGSAIAVSSTRTDGAGNGSTPVRRTRAATDTTSQLGAAVLVQT